ncbi:hypothetical protein [Acinetobacter bereziniae]|uniref:hypothetical protein n=1 Tax=Acinetobacter bereziniae TaxID=106648 RepID=UPI0012505B99|nr:hypothetical protein [Acinetobacter bereziniae]
MGLNSIQKISLGIVLFIILLIGWGVFPLFFKWIMISVSSKETDLKDYGALGDIYGSLNTLFTSATLAFVIYSTILQRQANQDSRNAMANQLRQARNATRKQLRQAQIATRRQLALAQATHDTQMKELKYANFTNVFYTLLNQKHTRYAQLQTNKNDTKYSSEQIFTHLSIGLKEHLNKKWVDISKVTKDEISNDFFQYMQNICNVANHSEIIIYFNVIIELLNFINKSDLDGEEKKYFKEIVRNSIMAGENAALLWVGSFRESLHKVIVNEKIFSVGYHKEMMPFVVKFYNKSCFSNSEVNEKWNEFIKDEPPE